MYKGLHPQHCINGLVAHHYTPRTPKLEEGGLESQGHPSANMGKPGIHGTRYQNKIQEESTKESGIVFRESQTEAPLHLESEN